MTKSFVPWLKKQSHWMLMDGSSWKWPTAGEKIGVIAELNKGNNGDTTYKRNNLPLNKILYIYIHTAVDFWNHEADCWPFIHRAIMNVHEGTNHEGTNGSRTKTWLEMCANFSVFLVRRICTVRSRSFFFQIVPEGCWNPMLEKARLGAARLFALAVRNAEWGTRRRRDWNWS